MHLSVLVLVVLPVSEVVIATMCLPVVSVCHFEIFLHLFIVYFGTFVVCLFKVVSLCSCFMFLNSSVMSLNIKG